MRLFIPSIGDSIRLTKTWTFTLHHAINSKLWDRLSLPEPIPFYKMEIDPSVDDYMSRGVSEYIAKKEKYKKQMLAASVKISKGTILIIDRVYIGNGASDFDSVTFRIPRYVNENHPLGGCRFWAKLEDVNRIYFEQYKD